MSRYRRSAASKLHRHCETCHWKFCKAPVEISVSCIIIKCRLLCGASFHMCKEDEHILLCPNEKVPCLNANYGCPVTMCRSRLAKHLEVCPASMVFCSMEWLRWPVEDIKSPLIENLIMDTNENQALDLSMSLRDQKLLCSRLNMRSFFPQLMQEPEEPIPQEEEIEEAAGGESVVNGELDNCTISKVSVNDPPKGDPKDLTVNKEKYDLFEKMFSKEMGGCRQAEKEESKNKTDKKEASKVSTSLATSEQGVNKEAVEPKVESREVAFKPNISQTGLAPWQEGVLERLGQEVNLREYNMYVVHHGRMLLTFGQIEACTPRDKDFVYGNLEPIPVQTLHSFNVPTSYRYKRIQMKDPAVRVKTENKSVDTSDLGVSVEDVLKMDEMFATLLCAAELEVRGHKISETVGTDGLYVDIATQTYNFLTAPFQYDATLTDITLQKELKLYLQLDTESATLRHNKSSSAFTFMCGHFFRRDEFGSHFKNVHSDIQSCLNGWFEQRCPLAYLGCTFTHRRLQPSTHRATVSYNQDLSIFTLRPEVFMSSISDSQIISGQKTQVGYEDSLSNLPFEVLCHIARYLDSFSLSQLALVSKLFRDVSATFLHERGMVGFKWRKKQYSHGGAKWKSSIVWEFSSLFSRVGSWCIDDTRSMSEHLKRCPFYQTEPKTKPFALTGMCETSEDSRVKQRKKVLTQFFSRR
ncbi:F-box only protein 40 [Trichomycterus rosablanca]|uniref:F-box only protein 40 n=1 Tax=Trichomycterus rosablanca TaxID=2290929 RepID=UPI002F35E7A6